MFPSNQDPSIGDYIKSINNNPIINNNTASNNDMFTSNNNNLNFPLLSNNNNNGISNSTSTSANLQIPSNTSWNFNTPDSQPQQLNFYDNGLQVALSNTTNTNFGNVNSALEQVILNVFQNRGRSQSASGNMQTSSLGFSPTLSNNQSSFAPQSNSFVQMSSSLPNTQTSAPASFQKSHPFNQQSNLSFQQPFTIVSDYKVSSTATLDQDSNNLNNSNNQTNVSNDVLHKMITEMMVSNPNQFNFGQLGQQSNSFNNSPTNNQPNQIFIQPPPQPPQIQTNQPMNNTNFSPILNSLMVNQPPSPNQIVFNNNSMQSVSPTSSNSPPTQPFTTMSIMPSSSTTPPSCNSTLNSSVPKSNSGKQLRQRSVSCSSSSNPYQNSPPQFVINPPITFCNQDSPKKGNRKSGIKFAIDFMDNAQQFDTKHTSLTPSTMKQHIAERDERERSGVKKRGRPKGSGVKQQVTRGGKLLFYQNCYNSVEVLYKDRKDPGRDDDNDESGFTV